MANSVTAKNVLGTDLQPCSGDPLTDFYRDGCCSTGAEHVDVHTVCAPMSAQFLEFSSARGNDLSTPHPEGGFPGPRSGDRWCVCADRWAEAGVAPRVFLDATNAATLEWLTLGALSAHAIA